MTTTFTATSYAICWITNNIETDSRAITLLSGKGSIYERYDEDCEKNRQIPIPKQTTSQQIGMSFALSHQLAIVKKRRRDEIVLEGIRLTKRQQELPSQKNPPSCKEKQLSAYP